MLYLFDAGQPRLEHSLERSLHYILLHGAAVSHQHRQYGGLQRGVLDGHECFAYYLHHLNRLPGDSQAAWPAITRTSLEPRPRGTVGERHRTGILGLDLDLLVLPTNHTRHLKYNGKTTYICNLNHADSLSVELERLDQWRCHGLGDGVLLPVWKTRVQWPCGPD
jgi:hypothetical protein